MGEAPETAHANEKQVSHLHFKREKGKGEAMLVTAQDSTNGRQSIAIKRNRAPKKVSHISWLSCLRLP